MYLDIPPDVYNSMWDATLPTFSQIPRMSGFVARFRFPLFAKLTVAILAAFADGTKLALDGIKVVAICGTDQPADLRSKALGDISEFSRIPQNSGIHCRVAPVAAGSQKCLPRKRREGFDDGRIVRKRILIIGFCTFHHGPQAAEVLCNDKHHGFTVLDGVLRPGELRGGCANQNAKSHQYYQYDKSF